MNEYELTVSSKIEKEYFSTEERMITLKDVMKNDEAREGNVTVINAETGLIETPRKMEYTLELTMMLEPRLQIGQLAKLESITAPRFNGTYKIIGVDHSATISENESNQNTTKVTLLYSAGGFSEF